MTPRNPHCSHFAATEPSHDVERDLLPLRIKRVAPSYIAAMFNLALMLQRKGAYAEAADYWRRYLTSDRASEWAARARRSLKFCEIQVNSLASRSAGRADSDQAAG
jgi:hypothetical protein